MKKLLTLAATKNSTADEARLTSLMTEAPQLQHFITDVGFAKAAMMGECGFLISFASTNFTRAAEYFHAGCERDAVKLSAVLQDFEGLINAFKEAVGDTAHMDGAFDKMFCRIHDTAFPLRLLPPYESVIDERFERYLELMRKNQPHWLP